jgi:endoglucanase
MENDWSSQPPKEIYCRPELFQSDIRKCGTRHRGRNAKRHLIVQSYLTNIELACTSFQMPQDPAADRLMVEVHYYDPYEFALKEDEPYNTQWGAGSAGDVSAWGQENWVDSSFGKMKQHLLQRRSLLFWVNTEPFTGLICKGNV